MGIYDTYGENGIQIKIGDVKMNYFYVGDKVPVNDGIYVAHEGIFVVKRGVLIAEFPLDALQDKYGCPIEINTHANNPVAHVVQQIKSEQDVAVDEEVELLDGEAYG